MAIVGVHDSAVTLWPQLIERAGLTGQRSERQGAYDKDLLTALREQLFPGAGGSFEDLLAESGLTAEALIRAFFMTLQPFALMKTDILALLTAAGARSSGESLKLRFNFDADGEPLDLLLDHFRQQMERFVEVTSELSLTVSYGDLWKISSAGGVNPNTFIKPGLPSDVTPGIQIWLARYQTGLFDPLPTDWTTGREDIDERMGRVVAFAEGYLAAFRRYAGNREQLRAAAYDKQFQEELDQIGMTVAQLWVLESDFWPREIVSWLVAIRAEHRAGNELSLSKMMAEIDRILPPPITRSRDLMRVLDDILDLPVWKHRHEVYAVWLGAQIFQALLAGGWQFRFHLQGDRLEFAFRGVHLASLTHPDNDVLLFWWTEFESSHDVLPSGHRSRGIKPDYRVRKAPLSDLYQDVLVIEAKQHLRSSTKEFVDALNDYAFACPQAAVFLANYGPVSAKTIEQVEKGARERCDAYAFLHPGEPDNIAVFRKDLELSLRAALAGAPRIVRDASIEVRLTWGNYPLDLDLHVARDGHDTIRVDYSKKEADGLRYEEDVTTGWGPEIVHINSIEGIYTVRIHQFSHDGKLADSGALVDVVFKRGANIRRVTFPVPTDLSSDRWLAAQIDAGRRTATAIET